MNRPIYIVAYLMEQARRYVYENDLDNFVFVNRQEKLRGMSAEHEIHILPGWQYREDYKIIALMLDTTRAKKFYVKNNVHP